MQRGSDDAGGGRTIGRREALLAAGGGLASIAFGLGGSGCGDEDEAPPRENLPGEAGSEAASIAKLLQLERQAATTFESGARFSEDEGARRFTDFAAQASAHADALSELLTTLGATPPAPAPNTIYVRDEESATFASKGIARRLIDEYPNAIAASSDQGRRRELLTMFANDAQHLVVLGGVRDAEPFPGDDRAAADAA